MSTACATCALVYGSALDPASEKPLLPGRLLECCSRSICSKCLVQNARFETYCPYCQISTAPSALPQGGLRDPPSYSTLSDLGAPPPADCGDGYDLPPAYDGKGLNVEAPDKKRVDEPTPDVLHFVTQNDTVTSLGLAYGVPVGVLRKINNIFSDHLLQGRRTVLIPGEYYRGGISLSPRPIDGEEEEVRKQKIRKWMMACKVAEYDVALLYLDNAAWDLDAAIQAHKDDERWEREHPLKAKGKGKGKNAATTGMRRFVGESSSSARSR
ncbi:hypothetical protein K431DRAFT_214416 [Polychaeton citri CBS 116435]|uniref:LysM domain-containing protein n=1 Tax=Polychaeton citri CBS 116435 TaxID=1314669 RepID=A0A9P4QJY8_9PEZI|nr:hypothetical protein K431DRAFT_214416 [Polychaeton citri CBS 116435]